MGIHNACRNPEHTDRDKNNRCIVCRNAWDRNRWRTWGPSDRERYVQQQKIARWQREYGLSREEAEELLSKPCAICGESPARAIDHDHRTGRVRAGLCIPCNANLGVLENREWVAKAEAYLDHFLLTYIGGKKDGR